MSEKFPSQMQDKFTVRFPDGLRDAVAERAKANGRSMNSEIVQILEDALRGKEQDLAIGMINILDSKGNEKPLPIETVRDVLLYAADVMRKQGKK